MAAEIGLLSMTQIQKLSQSQHHKSQPHHQQQNPNSTITSSTGTSTWMWNPREQHQEDDDSWEVRAFAEDTRNIMGTTWPPRSYTCTFCRREFRSAQALGGHMNVHRRDRARLHQAPPPAGSVNNPIATPHHPAPAFINVPPQELVANAGLCLLYHLPSPSATFTAPTPSTLLSVSSSSSYPQNNLMMQPCSPSFDFPSSVAQAAVGTVGINGVSSYSGKVEEPVTSSFNNGHLEELDLELRLGHKPKPTSQS